MSIASEKMASIDQECQRAGYFFFLSGECATTHYGLDNYECEILFRRADKYFSVHVRITDYYPVPGSYNLLMSLADKRELLLMWGVITYDLHSVYLHTPDLNQLVYHQSLSLQSCHMIARMIHAVLYSYTISCPVKKERGSDKPAKNWGFGFAREDLLNFEKNSEVLVRDLIAIIQALLRPV